MLSTLKNRKLYSKKLFEKDKNLIDRSEQFHSSRTAKSI